MRRDISTVYVQISDTALANWYGKRHRGRFRSAVRAVAPSV